MEAIASKVRELYARADDEGRVNIQKELRDLQWSLDSDWEFALRLLGGGLQLTIVRLAYDLNLFGLLAASDHPLGSKDLADATGASAILLAHFLRALAAFGFVKEEGPDEYSVNRPAKIFDSVHVRGAYVHCFDVHLPIYAAAPGYFKETKYQPVGSSTPSLFQKALKTGLQPFEWMRQRPEQMESLGHAMAFDNHNWTDSYPVEKEVATFMPTDDSALFVDVGGSLGHQAVAFRKKFPYLPGRMIVQDISATLEHAPPIDGIEFIEQDFFQPQTIKNAKFYYLRHILHDWNDEDSIRILKNLIPALGVESRIVIDDIVVPEANMPLTSAVMDITMMFLFAAQERTKAEWESLVDRAGLKIVDVHKYDSRHSSAIIVVPK